MLCRRIHLGYIVQMLKIADYLKAGCGVTILIADLHAYLDNMKSSLDKLEKRTRYYTVMIKTILKTLDISIDDMKNLKFIKGTDFQLSEKYTMDVYKLHSLCGVNDAKHAGAEVVKQSNNPSMTGLLYPGLQVLDEEYLNVDVQVGGIDQRKIFMYSRKYLPKMGYKKRFHFMIDMVPGLRFKSLIEIEKDKIDKIGKDKKTQNNIKEDIQEILTNNNDPNTITIKIQEIIKNQEIIKIQKNCNSDITNKMSASNPNTKIDLLDGKKSIKKKIAMSYCLPCEINDNTPLMLLEKILFPLLNRQNNPFIINRKEVHGGKIIYIIISIKLEMNINVEISIQLI